MEACHGVTRVPWQGAEKPPATLISATEQDVAHPDPPHGHPPSHRLVLGEPATCSASGRNMEPSARLGLPNSFCKAGLENGKREIFVF